MGFILYLHTVLISFINWLLVLTGMSGMFLLIISIAIVCYYNEQEQNDKIVPTIKKHLSFPFKIWLLVFMICSSFNIIVPSKKELIWIKGGSIMFRISDSDDLKELSVNAIKSLNSFLENENENEKSD